MATELWSWQAGGVGDDFLFAAAVWSDGSSILAGDTDGNWSTANSSAAAAFGVDGWAAVKLDSEGEILWTFQSEDFGGVPVKLATDGIRSVAIHEDRQSVALFGNLDFGGGQAVILLDSDDGSLKWIWEDSDTPAGDNFLSAKIVMAEDGSLVIAGDTFDDWGAASAGGRDFMAAKLDSDGTLVWKWQGGGDYIDELEAEGGLGLGQDGSTVICGEGWGNFTGVDPVGGFPDLSAVKLDSDGNELWRWQNGSTGYDYCKGAVVDDSDGSVILSGWSNGDWSGQGHQGGYSDFIAVKLDADGKEVWRWQEGTELNDYITGAAAMGMGTNDGSVVLCGYTSGNWWNSSRPTSSLLEDRNFDFAVVALASNGTELWRWQGGSDGDDRAKDVSVSENGWVVVAGSTNGFWGGGNISTGGDDFVAVMLGIDGSSYLDGDGASSAGGDTSAAGDSGSNTTSAPVVSNDSSTNVDGGGDTGGGESNDTTLAPGVSGGSSSGDGDVSVSMIVGGLTAVAVLGVFLVGLGWAWRKKKERRPGVNEKAQTKRSSKNPGVEGGMNGSGGDIGFSRVSNGWKQQRQQGAADPPTEGVIGNPLFDHPNRTTVSAAAPSAAAAAAGGSEGGSGSNGKGISWEDRGLTAVPFVSADDDIARSGKQARLAAGRSTSRQGSSVGLGVRRAVLEAAQELAARSQMPGVSEVAGLVVVLINLVSDSRGNDAANDQTVKRSHSIIIMLHRAADVLGRNEFGDAGEAGRVLVEDVHDAIADLVELIRTYQSKNKLSQVMMSTLFRRRQEEAEAVIERAISRLQLGLHVQVGRQLDEVGRDVKEGFRLESARGSERVMETSVAESLAEDRRARRQRKLDQIEIPAEHVTVSDELLGKGGFGAVYIADFNGRNAAVKVLQMDDHELGVGAGEDSSQQRRRRRRRRQRRAFLQELNVMICLRSPHTVNVFGAITSHKDRLILVMELLSGGDLRAFLKRNADRPLREDRARRIIGDVCAGMAFLHGKDTVHGDLKSANVLLDGAGRAKIGDFGTSRWAKHSNSTGLATYTSSAAQGTEMSLAWAAPEVLETKGISFASDAYSFGIVAWEVLTRKNPWADQPRARDIFLRVVMKGERPVIPADAPRDIAGVVRACWSDAPRERPAMSEVMKTMKSHGWED